MSQQSALLSDSQEQSQLYDQDMVVITRSSNIRSKTKISGHLHEVLVDDQDLSTSQEKPSSTVEESSTSTEQQINTVDSDLQETEEKNDGSSCNCCRVMLILVASMMISAGIAAVIAIMVRALVK